MRVIKHFLTPVQVDQLCEFASQSVFESGRQGTGYERVYVPSHQFQEVRNASLQEMGFPLGSAHDCYILRYQPGSYIPRHKVLSLI